MYFFYNMICQELPKKWSIFWDKPILKYLPPLGSWWTGYFPPFANLWVLVIIIIQCIWTFIVVETFKPDFATTTFDTSTIIGILTGTLAFILPMQLSTALDKNKSGLDNYNQFCAKNLEFAWELTALYKESKNDKDQQKSLQIFNILVALPALVKHQFRGTIDFEKMEDEWYQRFGQNSKRFIDSPTGIDLKRIFNNKIPSNKNGVKQIFLQLMDYTQEFTDESQTDLRSPLLGTWKSLYSSWITMVNLNVYKIPVIFTYVLNFALGLYIAFLPFTIIGQKYNAIWMVAIVGYFFLGLNLAGREVANAFAEGAKGFQTVTAAQKQNTVDIKQVWDVRKRVIQHNLSSSESSLLFFTK